MARECSVDGCDRVHWVGGLCRLHHDRQKAHGTADGGSRNHGSPAERFWRKVEKAGPDECWEWTAKRQRSGYGRFGLTTNEQTGAHQFSFMLANGYKPAVVMHTCDNRGCVNPAHLRAGTYATNNADMRAKGRDNRTDRPRGSTHHRSKLTEADVRLIKSRPDEKPGKLAAEFGVKSAVVQRIRLGTAWKHVT